MDAEISQVKYCICIHVFKPQLGRAAIRLKRQAPGCPAGAFWPGLHLGMQMAVDMKWRDALAVRCIAGAFTREQQQAGWPQAMEPAQLAAVQRPYEDMQGRRAMWALRDAVIAACQEQALVHEEQTQSVKVADARDFIPTSLTRNWPEAYTREGRRYAYTRPAQYEDRTVYRIGPDDFAAWLDGEGLVPSSHMAAWFVACGKAQAASASVAAALSADEVQDLPTLVRYRLQFAGKPAQQRPQWTAPHVMLVRAWLRQEQEAGRDRGAVGRLAGDMGMTRQGLQSVLDKHVQRAQATAFDGLARRANGGAA